MEAKVHGAGGFIAIFLILLHDGNGLVGVCGDGFAVDLNGACDFEFGLSASEKAPEGLGHQVGLHGCSPSLVVGAGEEGDGVESVVGHVELVVSVWRVVCYKPQNKTVVSVVNRNITSKK